MSKFEYSTESVVVSRAEYDALMAMVRTGRDYGPDDVSRFADEIFRVASGWTSGGLSRLQTNADPYCRCGKLKADESPGCTWHAARARAEVDGQLELPLDWA
jgi:hypothetical protein